MGLQKITFEGGNVTSKIDSDLYHFLFSSDVGILKGLKSECGYTLANNTITFSDGYVSVYGRIIYVENQTTIGVTPDSSKYGYVVLGVNTSDNTVSLYLKEQTGSYPSLTVTNLLTTDGLYELALCTYTKTTTSVTLSSFSRKMISTENNKINSLDTELKEYLVPISKNLIQVSNGVYQIFNVTLSDISNAVIYIFINDTSVVSLPTDSLFVDSGFYRDVSYVYAGSNYTLNIMHSSNVITLSCGNTLHEVTEVYIKK